ncbi:MAG: histidine--tRNA ligase [Peptococcaceae bacterium]|jgi:histidyl-tRNA synthetase|nr:histidine--tRNA ligase [Peptococcaceae bacterium]MBQ2003940.1 histidine--tRNA ligase [Peptococcaceae bacterium]MBQ2021235.1 histidine--tRNA ligase [Peptococcaceae bacterium]MBQ2368994.1 histidine--tRNA ligase [Peptococcaceae bacterium]MBQ2431674.1 histidine--tRNA ligase [Peptococcaceae bacterium]
MLTTRPRGTNDFLPGESEKWQYIEQLCRQVCAEYGYKEIRLPIFEHTEVYLRSVGETSDIVEKEMYSFEDKGLTHVTLRPEGTAGTVRAFLENRLYADPQPTKLYYMGPMFRYDKPQAGRYRQFNQFGIEVFGADHATIDAEVITLAVEIFKRLGLTGLSVKINTVGCADCRPKHMEELKTYFRQHEDNLCETCRDRLERNPLRILDCKEDGCKAVAKGAPTTIEAACDNCSTHFNQLLGYLDAVGISYEIDTNLVRGLDYYVRTAFEVVINSVGSAQNALCGGGRYNGMVEQFGGDDMPGIGYAMGMERLLLTLKEQGIELPVGKHPDVYIAPLGDAAQKEAFVLTQALRSRNIYTEKDYLGKSLKAQMKAADRFQVKYCVIIGDSELEKGIAVVREMATGEQQEIALSQLVEDLEGRLK